MIYWRKMNVQMKFSILLSSHYIPTNDQLNLNLWYVGFGRTSSVSKWVKINFYLFSVSVAGTRIIWGPNHNFETLILKRCEKSKFNFYFRIILFKRRNLFTFENFLLCLYLKFFADWFIKEIALLKRAHQYSWRLTKKIRLE